MVKPDNWYARVLIVCGLTIGIALPVNAANWFKLRGTEPGGTAHTLQLWGFLQPTFVKDNSDEIDGAVGGASAMNGDKLVQGTIPPDRTSQKSFFMRRARIGIRGTMLPINNDIDYFILTEWGQNGVTRADGGATLLDASVTFNQFSRGLDDDGLQKLGARVRVGQFLFSQTSESLSHSTPGRRVHVFMPESTFQLALRRLASDNARSNWPEDEVPVNAARDIGVEVFDWVEFKDPVFGGGPLEFTYSAALGNGTTIGELNRDDNFRRYYWLSIAKLWDDTRGPRRHDVQLYGFYQKGDIEFNDDVDNNGVSDRAVPAELHPWDLSFGPGSCGNRVCKNGNEDDYEQKYYGIGIEYFDKPFDPLGQIRFNAEWQRQEGLIFDGAQSPSSAVHDNNGGFESILYDDDGFTGANGGERQSTGWYVDGGYDLQQHLPWKNRTTINLRYDKFIRNEGNFSREAEWNNWTLTGEYFFHKKARITASYQWRDVDTDGRKDKAGNPPFKTNGNAALEQVEISVREPEKDERLAALVFS